MNQQTQTEITRMDELRRVKGVSEYRIAKDLDIARTTVADFFKLVKTPSMETYLKIKEYLEAQ